MKVIEIQRSLRREIKNAIRIFLKGIREERMRRNDAKPQPAAEPIDLGEIRIRRQPGPEPQNGPGAVIPWRYPKEKP